MRTGTLFLCSPMSRLFSTRSNAFSASVSSPEPWGESQQAPGPPHLDGLRCSLGGPCTWCQWKLYPRPQTQTQHQDSWSWLLFIPLQGSISWVTWLTALFQYVQLWGFTPRIITRRVLNFLSSSFYKLWILWDLWKHQKVAMIEVNDSLLLIKK